MLNIEVIRFEAQDVITASVATPEAPKAPATIVVPGCTNPNGHSFAFQNVNGVWKSVCSFCGAPVEAKPGDSVVGGN